MHNTINAKIYKNKEGIIEEYIEVKQVTEEEIENTDLFKWFKRIGGIIHAITAVFLIVMVIAQIWMRFN